MVLSFFTDAFNKNIIKVIFHSICILNSLFQTSSSFFLYFYYSGTFIQVTEENVCIKPAMKKFKKPDGLTLMDDNMIIVVAAVVMSH